MRIAVISDLHLDINKKYPIVEMVCNRAMEEGSDVLVIAGDFSNDVEETLGYVEQIKSRFNGDVYFVPGNHDMYNIDDKYDDTYVIYDKYMKHENSLMMNDVNLKDSWVLLGDMFWYDYSLGDTDKYSENEFKAQFHEGMSWSDYRYVDWQNDDKSISDILVDRIEKRLIEHQGKNIIVISHMVMNKEFVGYEKYPNAGYFGAFTGSKKLGALMSKYKVNTAVVGHVHMRKEETINGTHYICPCLGYYFEWDSNSPKEEVEKTMKFIDI